MGEIGFYHLSSTSLERALPKLLERARIQGHRIVVRAASPERVEHLCVTLWTYEEASFLPHGSVRDGNAAMQPIWLTHRGENPNGGKGDPAVNVGPDGCPVDAGGRLALSGRFQARDFTRWGHSRSVGTVGIRTSAGIA